MRRGVGAGMVDTWMRAFNEGLAEMFNGAQFCDLSDEDQTEILRMRDTGMIPDEALDVFEEVQDVE